MKRALLVPSAALAAGLLVLIGFGLSGGAAAEKKAEAKRPGEPAVERTRDVVQMLDGVYKNTIVLITDKYVHTEDDYPAGSAAVELFRIFSKSGRQDVQLLDATGAPYESANVADDAFEKEGVKQIKAGKDYYEQVVQKEDGWYLRAMTAVPVVHERCVMCHPHYADVKKGEAIGTISYTLPIK